MKGGWGVQAKLALHFTNISLVVLSYVVLNVNWIIVALIFQGQEHLIFLYFGVFLSIVLTNADYRQKCM